MTEQHEDGDELFFDELRDSYDYCYECSGYGDDYSIDDEGEWSATVRIARTVPAGGMSN